MSKLVLIDGNAILHRAYHALPPLTTKKGEPINAVYGFVSMLLRIISELKPTHLAVCFDRKEPTFRKKAFKDYQAHRPETDKELISQFAKARETVKSFNIPFYEKKGFEADDVIGTLAKRATESRSRKKTPALQLSSSPALVDEVVIVTGDKDILQLVNDKVKVYLPKRGLSDAQLTGTNEVIMKMGVTPKQIVDYKALVGDSSDNYKGVPGIGPKTAVDLLSRFKTVKQIYKNIDSLPDSTAKKLREGKKLGDMSYKLAKIVTDVNMDFDFEKMEDWELGSSETFELFEEYGFKTLGKRVETLSRKLKKEAVHESQGSLF